MSMNAAGMYKHLRARNVHVVLWVLNSEEEFDEALEMGVDWVMTDFPTLLREYIEKVEKKVK